MNIYVIRGNVMKDDVNKQGGNIYDYANGCIHEILIEHEKYEI